MKQFHKLALLLLTLLSLPSISSAQISLLRDYENTSSAPIGTFMGVAFREAGFSGLYPIPGTNGTEFWTMSDRGVNVDCANANPSTCRPTYDKMYAFPTYAPKIHRIRITGTNVQILQSITIKRPNGTGATGIINPTNLGSTALEIASTDTVLNCANFNLKTTPKDTFGIDPEGIVVDKNGNFWLCDEGGATIWVVNPSGILIRRYTPYANLAGVQAVDMQIDTAFKYRRNNRGFEGIAIAPNGKIYAAIQSPMFYPSSAVGATSRVHRIIEIDPTTNSQRMLVYLNDGTIGASGANQIRPQDWKIGDMAAINDSTFLVLDAAARGTTDIKRLYTININQATVVNSGLYGGTTTVEGLADSTGLAAFGIRAVRKTLTMDLLASGWPAALDKAEGLAIINDSTIAIGNDNDFGQTCPLANGIPIPTTNTSHVITYRLSGANKLANYRFTPTTLTQGQTGISSSQTPYLVPSSPEVKVTAILTVGDTANNGYKMVGIPDGTGAWDNGNGTFTLLVNHELGSTAGITRAHGAKGAFVSRWVINKNTMAVESGSDLITKVNLFTPFGGYILFNPADTTSRKAFGRFCSADLPPVSAFYNAATGLGTQERIFMNGEETGAEGRAFGHVATGVNAGTTWELPYLGKFSWENSMASPLAQNKTIVAGTDDATPGQVYMYIGTKTNTGSEVDRAGLNNGRLYGVAVTGLTAEVSASFPAPNTPFTMVDLGIVKDSTGAALNTRSNTLGVTNFLRPEDGHWDPINPNDFYFATTNSFTAPSRLWRMRFTDITKPELGGTITAVLDGTEGAKMIDNIAIDNYGNVILQEDVGGQTHLGKIWQYNIATDRLKLIATHDSSRFTAGMPGFLTIDEEASGVIDMESILGAGNFLMVDQAHYAMGTELVEGGQIFGLYNPDTYKAANGNGINSSQTSYLTPSAPGVKLTAILTVGDTANNGYKMVGIPDGTGAWDNGNGTFTLLVNHELGSTAGITRAHGAKGAFVSRWVINKNTMAVESGSDLITKVNLFTPFGGYILFNPADTTSRKAFGRFCSADLPPVSAFYNAATGLGTQERIFMNGEETGAEGRAFGHVATGVNAGTTWELPYLGKFSWENSMASPLAQNKTIVAGTDDATPGQVYMYIGTKTNTGSEVDRAGLNNGRLYGVAVTGLTAEVSASFPAPNTPFTMVDLGIVKDSTGAALNTRSNTLGVTNFLRPEDGHWDPMNPNDFYFATTNSFTAPSRLWRMRFTDIKTPELGGTITAVLDGTEGAKMIDNIAIDNFGHILLQEDVGGQTHLGKIWQYTIATDQLKLIATHDSSRFIPGAPNFLTIDEEASGIIDMESILGAGKFLMVDQAHYGMGTELVEGGQILGLYNPDTYRAASGTGISSSQTPYLSGTAPGVKVTAILTVGDTANNGYKMVGIPDGTGAWDNGNGTFTLLVNHELGSTAGITRAHGAKGAFVSRWVINKNTMAVESGSDLITKVNLFTPFGGYILFNPADTTSRKAFGRFCSADLPPVSAFYNAATGLGTQERIFMNGEETGAEGRAFGHVATGVNAGTTWELPYLGKFSWENSMASPLAQNKTIVAGTDDATPGQVYMYIGTKTNTGSEVDRAGLNNGRLYGVAVTGLTAEVSASFPAPNTPFTMVDLGIVKDSTGAALNTRSNTLGVTNFLRPEDGHWDPINPNDFYFATTNSFTAPSRLWRMRFTDIRTPELGGTITAVLDGTEGAKMIDNIAIDNFGHILLQEDVGGQTHLGKIWQYTIATDQLKLIATHDSSRFIPGAPNFLTIDEEASGIIDMESILGAGKFLMVDQAHYGMGTELVEGGQILGLEIPTNNFTLQVLHASDMESSIDAVIDAPNFAAVMNKLEGTYGNTVKLASGDCFIPSPFLSAGEDASIQTPLRNTASSYYAGSTAGLRAAIGRVDVAMMNIMGFQGSALGNHEFDLGTSEVNSIIGVDIRSNGADKRWVGAQFPYLSANLNFSADANLSYLYTNKRLPVDSFKTSPNITANAQKKGLAPSSILIVNGEKIGIVGATTQVLASISSPGATTVIGSNTDNMPGLAAILQPVIDSLRFIEGINKIIVMSHLQQLANEKALAPLLKGVDIIIAGGSHALTADGNDRIRPGNVVVDKYPIMTQNNDLEPLAILNTTAEWKYVGRFVANFSDAGVLIPSLLDSTINGAYAADTAMVTQLWGNYASAFTAGSKAANVRTLCAAIGNVIVSKDGNKFGKASVFLEGRRDFVRTQETNLGNVSSDANLWLAKRYDPQVRVSIKNGGGIRSAIGQVVSVGGGVQLLPTAANPSAGKNAGDISQLDIENSLRFNNKLSIVTVNAAGLKRLLEHGVSATKPGITPGQFPQVGGVMFSYDTLKTVGNKIQSMVIVDSLGNRLDTIVRFGSLHGDTSRLIKVVTLDFLAGGGDNYPFVANGFNRVNLDTAFKDSMYARFQANGSEQDAFADFMYANHNSLPYAVRDTNLLGDNRIQLLNTRQDGIFQPVTPVITIAAARALPTDTVKIRGVITRAWGRFIYIQDPTGAIGVRQSSGAMVDSILSGGLKAGDSVEVSGGRSDFNNYSQVGMQSGAYRSRSYITKISSNNPLPMAQVITVKQLLANPESFESELVRIVNLRTGATGNFASSTNYNVWDGTTTGDTTVLRVISSQDTEIDDSPALAIPTGTFTFEGTLIQFCSSPASGCTTGYQLQGVRKSEIIAPPPVLTLGAFNLLAPANNARVVVEENSTSPINVTWSRSANASIYKWFATLPIGTFTSPLLVLPSNNLGADTMLTLTSGAIDGILSSFGLKKGDSISLKWTVYSYKAPADSLKASQEFNITLVRNRKLQAFSLLTPGDNARLVVEENETTPVVITWQSSASVATYNWFLDIATGNFSNPWARLASDNSGTDTKLSLTSGAIDNLLNAKGVVDGDSVNLKWTVRAYETNDSLQASQTFNLKAVRKKAVGIAQHDFSNSLLLYPNPTQGNSTLSFELNQSESIQITLLDVQGRMVTALPSMEFNSGKNEIEIHSSVLQSGIYFVQISSGEKTSLIKLVVTH